MNNNNTHCQCRRAICNYGRVSTPCEHKQMQSVRVSEKATRKLCRKQTREANVNR